MMKYCPEFPSRFGCLEDGRLFCGGFFDYYNNAHRHSGLGLMTPAAVHYGRADELNAARRQVLLEAHRAHPERFVHGTPQPPVLPRQVWINPPPEKTTPQEALGATFSGRPIPELPPDSSYPDAIASEPNRDRTALTPHVNAFAVPTGYIFVTRGLVESLETEPELAAILAHEIAHVESRHSYRHWRNTQKLSIVTGIMGALAGATDNAADDVVAAMTSFTAGLFMAGHGRDREREADLFASFYLNDTDIGDQPLLNSFRKLKFARDAYDPFGGGGGLFASHPHIDERLEKASATVTAAFADDEVFHGVENNGTLVATLRFDIQRLFRNELDVVATLSTTAELGKEDNVNTINIRVGGERITLRERTAEKIFPSDEVSAVFGNDDARGLIEGPVEEVELDLRNVDRWERVTDTHDNTALTQ